MLSLDQREEYYNWSSRDCGKISEKHFNRVIKITLFKKKGKEHFIGYRIMSLFIIFRRKRI